jgi:hypothetical protein
VGGVAGMFGGAVYGFSGLSDIDALYLNEALTFLDRERDLQDALITQVERAMPSELLAHPELASAHVIVRLVQIDFIQGSKTRINMKAVASLTVARQNGESDPPTTSEFGAESKELELDTLLANDASELNAVIDGFVADLSTQISKELLRTIAGAG